MEKNGKMLRGGIRRKYLRLLLIVIAMVVAVFVAMILIQMLRLSAIVEDTSKQQEEVISEFSEGSLKELISRRLSNIAGQEAESVNNLFWESVQDTMVLRDYYKKVLQNSENYLGHEIKAPDVSLEGEVSAQLLTEEGVDLNDPKFRKRSGCSGHFLMSQCLWWSNPLRTLSMWRCRMA